MIGRAIGVVLAFVAGVAQAHEEDFPLPWQASGIAFVDASGGANQGRPEQPPGQTLPLKPARRIQFETNEGTWMSLDVSRDDRRLVFDLLGDLYRLDATGSRAVAITHGLAFDTQPTYSPDGQWIAFISDRSGAENLWLVREDGSEARQISFGDDDTVLVSPAWSPDGRSVYVSRFRWSLNNYELWCYGLDGTQTLIVPIKAADQPRSAGISSLGAVASPDGRKLYFARRTGDPDEGQWTLVCRDLQSGSEQTIVPDPPGPGRPSNAGKYFRPALSPDGRSLVYASRRGGETGLRLRDLGSGADRWLAFPIDRDQVDAQSWQDLVPRYAFMHDGTSVILSRQGRFERVPVGEGATQAIPFTASVDLDLGAQTRVKIAQDTGPVRVRLIQTPEQSPDGKLLAFSALGHVYVMPLGGRGGPRRLTQSEEPEFHPSWSPDGKHIAFITWSPKSAGHVWTVPAEGGTASRLSDTAAFYTRPVFSPDGREVMAIRSNHAGRLATVMDFPQTRAGELVAWPVSGGTQRVVYTGTLGGKPHFGAGKLYLQSSTGLTAIDPASGSATPAAMVLGPGWYFQDTPVPVDDNRVSPDGRWLLVQIAQQLHVLEMPSGTASIDLSRPQRAHRRITDVGADFFEWADGGKTITWAVGSTFYRRPAADIEFNPPDRPSWSADARTRRTQAFNAVVEVPRDTPRGTLLLRGARIITMRGDEVIESGELLVRDDRIVAVGPRGALQVPADAQVQDVAGKTIVPGLIDIHDHVADIRRDVLSMQSWGLSARLAYGITTAFDPSTLSIDMFAYQDLVDAGLLTGARVPSTGTAMFSFNRIASPQEAKALLTRYRDHYRTHNAKQYLIGNRRQRQWLIQAAGELGMMPTTEGSLSLKLELGQIMDGYAGSEHALPTALHRDVIELVARSGTSYDATLQIKNGGPPAQDQFVTRDRPLEDEKFMRTRPTLIAAGSVLKRQWVDPSVLVYPRIGGDVARIQRAGGVVGIGSHGEIPGFGLHWEMEAHVQGGMLPLEALRAATIGSATAIGRGAEFGSLEPGKFADLLILEADPRADIRNARAILQVMKNGRLYDAASLDEVWPRQRLFERSWFADEQPAPR
jgi:Tol biopolymer transport system component